MPVDGVPVPAFASLGKCLALSSANGPQLTVTLRISEGEAECLAWPAGTVPAGRSWERIGGWAVKNGGSTRISEVWGWHVRLLSLYC